MADAIEIRLNGDASGVIKAAREAGESFEDVGSSLDGLTKEVAAGADRMESDIKGVDFDSLSTEAKTAGDKAGNALENSLDGAVRETKRDADKIGDNLEKGVQSGVKGADSEVDKLDKTFNDMAREAQRAGKKTGDNIEKGVKHGTKDAGRAVDNFKDEAKQNFSETASSFDGSMESAVDGVQGTLGGLATALGPAGAIGAGVAAAALGTAMTFATQWSEQAEEAKQALIDMYAEAAEAGRDFVDAEQVNAEARRIFLDTGLMQKYRDEAEKIGVDIQTYVRAQAGDYDALEFSIQQARDTEEKRRAEFNASGSDAPFSPLVESIKQTRSGLEGLAGQHKTNQKAVQDYQEFQAESSKRERDQINRTRATDQARWEAAARAANKVPSHKNTSVNVRVNVDDSALDRSLAVTRQVNVRLNAVNSLRNQIV
jgi:hypothetical protein